MTRVFMLCWCVAALLTLNRVLRPAAAPPPSPIAGGGGRADTLTVIQALQTRCELPAGTTVFVVRGGVD
ncbi:MAG TPA: hypothetical protein VD793_06915 [Gemmatimonadales bacterium]|nr:hypothetical protein [Gemmatimonadales bacterium]